MGEYASGLTTKEVCELEVQEATEIMEMYQMDAQDIDTIQSIIQEAYFQLGEMCKCGRALEAILMDKGFTPEDYFWEYMQKMGELTKEESTKETDEIDEDIAVPTMDCMSR